MEFIIPIFSRNKLFIRFLTITPSASNPRSREEPLKSLIKIPMTVGRITKSLGISRTTVYRLLSELEER